ncbi:ATP-binding cassette domain-containing protein [Paraburkholderia metrosideri]|jgi:ferric hydroxamate transport system ATP-binding protein|uniref:Iron(3+)-hydroxamate import ATP-binding protein FhuC n=1 Tax=Paraburkholderia metrosideri TaxID=580937 RepID=A0ABM8NKK7_9BURK|nr:ATP-binding cassette domain-containing protein [Paraburkholderia metrosideri]CAD6530411.1 Iron(3+)-hydroxamate import ATP-binding protein FhuC [Paraburkholderia metrosideri]
MNQTPYTIMPPGELSHAASGESARASRDDTLSAAWKLEQVGFVAGERTLLHPLDLTLDACSVTGLIGHNGSGKSTLIKLLARQQQPASGTLSFAGKPLHAWDNRAFAREVAYLPQQLPNADGMTVRELVALGRYPWHGALGRFTAQDRERVDEAMSVTDVAHYADRAVDSLSGGERQRAWLAMLVAQDCRCMLLDEPTSALDVGHQLAVLDLVRTLCVTRGMSAVVVLHDVNMAARFCDHIVALRAGRLLMRVPAAQVMDAKQLETIYGVPMGVITDPRSGHTMSFPL